MYFTITYSEALDMIVENLHTWWWNPDSSAYAACGPLEKKTIEELEELLNAHVRVEEQQGGFEDGLLSCVKFKIVRDHERAKNNLS